MMMVKMMMMVECCRCYWWLLWLLSLPIWTPTQGLYAAPLDLWHRNNFRRQPLWLSYRHFQFALGQCITGYVVICFVQFKSDPTENDLKQHLLVLMFQTAAVV